MGVAEGAGLKRRLCIHCMCFFSTKPLFYETNKAIRIRQPSARRARGRPRPKHLPVRSPPRLDSARPAAVHLRVGLTHQPSHLAPHPGTPNRPLRRPQAHARALVGDLASATSRLRNMQVQRWV